MGLALDLAVIWLGTGVLRWLGTKLPWLYLNLTWGPILAATLPAYPPVVSRWHDHDMLCYTTAELPHEEYLICSLTVNM